MNAVVDRAFAQTDDAIAIAREAIADLQTVTTQRDVLLAALKLMHNAYPSFGGSMSAAQVEASDAARAAIAAAEGHQ
jgi:hypothetical protein